MHIQGHKNKPILVHRLTSSLIYRYIHTQTLVKSFMAVKVLRPSDHKGGCKTPIFRQLIVPGARCIWRTTRCNRLIPSLYRYL